MSEGDWPSVRMYTTSLCSDCLRSKALLERLGVPYEEVNIKGDAAAMAEVRRLNDGRDIVPTIIIGDSLVLSEPSDKELAEALGTSA